MPIRNKFRANHETDVITEHTTDTYIKPFRVTAIIFRNRLHIYQFCFAGRFPYNNIPIAPQKAERTAQENFANPDLAQVIHSAAQKYAVDPKLVSAVAEVESGGDQNAVSPAGAVGVMQLMPETAAGLGVNPYDMKSNVEGGAKYLREMLDTFDGDVKKAVAAYNAGPNAVKAYGGVPPYAETQNYVTSVLDIYR